MKTHTSQFKDSIKQFGRELDSKITYTIDGVTTELGAEQLNSVSPHYEGAILKSVMKQLDIDSNVEIPVGTILTYEFGVKVGNSYEYITYGNYVVKEVEKQEDTNSYKITCYDKMLYAMKDYENTGVTYPTTVRTLLEKICEKIGLEFAGGQFSNYDKQIQNELYLDENGNSLNYTYRDVLDEIAQVSGGTICIDADDKLEIRYIQDVGEITNVSNSNISLTDGKEGKLQKFELEGKTTQANTPSPSSPSELKSVGYQNLFDKDSVITGMAINRNTGQELTTSAYSDFSTSDYCNVSPNTQYYFGISYTSNYYGVAFYDNNKNYISGVPASNTFTTSNDTYYVRFTWTTANYNVDTIQLEKGSTARSYIPYGKYGIEVKTTGKNLFDKTSITNNYYYNSNGDYTSVSNTYLSDFINVNANDNYTLQFSETSSSTKRINYFDEYKNWLSQVTTSNTATYTMTIPSNAKYVRISFNIAVDIDTIQLENGSTATDYEPYVSNTNLIILDEPLRAIGNYKDLLYIKNNMLYVERKIGSLILNGTETEWGASSVLTNTTAYNFNKEIGYNKTSGNSTYALVNYFAGNSNGFSLDTECFWFNSSGYFRIRINTSTASNVTNLKAWLSTHNTEVDYVLATPYIEELGSVQVPSTYDGITYIETTDANTPAMNISYVSGYEEIDEEMLKDVNVNFGEKYGTINTVVLSRSAGADKISLSQPLDLADEDKVAIEIADNQIMNGNNRADFLQGLLTQLNGLEYYINDFSSTGICYLDLCDMYRVKIGDTSYKCIMFNDSVNITQGLEEQVYTDTPEEAEEDYKYIGDDDRKVTQAYIIADKTRGEIVAVTNKIDETNGRINSVETRQTATEQTIEVKTQNIDADGNITEVTTTNGFTFNAQGLDIHTSDNAFHTTIDEDSTEYKDGDTVVSTTSKDGSALRQLRMLEQNYYSYNASNTSDIMDTSNYDFVDERVEDSGDYVYATFYNGED